MYDSSGALPLGGSGTFLLSQKYIFEFLSLQKLEELEKEEELREAAGLYDSEPVRECRSNFWIIIIILPT